FESKRIAMSQDADSPNHELDQHRPYLRLLAGMQLNHRLWPQIDPSDVVAETLLQAYAKREKRRGANLLAWLRGILRNRLLTAIRKEKRKTREKQLVDALDQSSCWINAAWAAECSSPSKQVIKQEVLEKLANALVE